MARPRVVLVESGAGFGGSVVCFARVAVLLRERFDMVLVIAHPDEATRQHLAEWGLQFLHIPTHRRSVATIRQVARFNEVPALRRILLVPLLAFEALQRSWSLRRFAAAVKELQPDLISLNTGTGGGRIYNAVAGIAPVVLHMRGNLTREIVRRVRPPGPHPLLIAMSRTILDAATAAGWPRKRGLVLYDSLPLRIPAEAPPPSKGNSNGKLVVSLVASLEPWKGHEVFIEAAGVVLSQLPSVEFRIIGGRTLANPEYPETLAAIISERGLTGSVILAGFRPDSIVAMQEADIVVHASIKPEPFGLVVVEAMLSGRPIVAAGEGGPTEVLEEGETGFLTAPGDSQALAERLLVLLRDPELRDAVGARARAAALGRFNAEGFANQLEAYYRAEMNRETATSPAGP